MGTITIPPIPSSVYMRHSFASNKHALRALLLTSRFVILQSTLKRTYAFLVIMQSTLVYTQTHVHVRLRNHARGLRGAAGEALQGLPSWYAKTSTSWHACWPHVLFQIKRSIPALTKRQGGAGKRLNASHGHTPRVHIPSLGDMASRAGNRPRSRGVRSRWHAYWPPVLLPINHGM